MKNSSLDIIVLTLFVLFFIVPCGIIIACLLFLSMGKNDPTYISNIFYLLWAFFLSFISIHLIKAVFKSPSN